MTIAAVYVSPEGVVLGADSTSSFINGSGNIHYFDFAQKLFEIGEKSTLGFLTWGMGGLGEISYRHLLAKFDDKLRKKPVVSVNLVAEDWSKMFDAEYRALAAVKRATELHKIPPFDKADPGKLGNRTLDEQKEYSRLLGSTIVGFCIAGYVMPNREPVAVTVTFAPTDPAPTIVTLPKHQLMFYGMPNAMNRLIHGMDDEVFTAIQNSPKWSGTKQDLGAILNDYRILPRAQLPLRDAIDYVHSGIYLTIKATKFSTHPQMCGGPIEIAVISSDRKFRWVRHKDWDSAITDGDLRQTTRSHS
jgi:hypothetical protein